MVVSKSILSIGNYQVLQHTRTLILQQSGYDVAEAVTEEQAIAFLEGSLAFDLVIMCHSLPERSRLFLADKVKELRPKLPIMIISQGFETSAVGADSLVEGLESPGALLEMVGSLTLKKAKEDGS
jgi:CheY-like chemotaxis protein